ncbi:MAG TPA: PEP-utilizing enzyme [Candidatus Saccharimonadales bacterium]
MTDNKVLTGETWRVGCHAAEPVTGRVAIVRSQADLEKVQQGDILVALQTDVNYTPQMLDAAAVITVEGGRFSHAATFSRENAIPCLIGVVGILDELHDDDTIVVDTQAKTITVVPTPELEA